MYKWWQIRSFNEFEWGNEVICWLSVNNQDQHATLTKPFVHRDGGWPGDRLTSLRALWSAYRRHGRDRWSWLQRHTSQVPFAFHRAWHRTLRIPSIPQRTPALAVSVCNSSQQQFIQHTVTHQHRTHIAGRFWSFGLRWLPVRISLQTGCHFSYTKRTSNNTARDGFPSNGDNKIKLGKLGQSKPPSRPQRSP